MAPLRLGAVQPINRAEMRLLHRLFLANAAVLIVATLILALSPVTVSFPVSEGEALVLVGGLICMLAADLVVFRRTLAPLDRLATLMGQIDPLQPGRRLPAFTSPELAQLTGAFNGMLERLEAERRDSARRALAAQEEERRRISRELHDEVGQTLTAVMLRLEYAGRADAAVREQIDEVREHVRTALDEVRGIAGGLRPVLLDELGLASALKFLVADARDNGNLKVAYRAADLPELAPDAELVIYRVAQEALTNVARHAVAANVAVEVGCQGARVALTVADDGRGRREADEGNGIRGMRERALLVGGALELRERHPAGTELRLTIPIV